MDITKSEWRLITELTIAAMRKHIDNDLPTSGIMTLMTIPEKGRISFREVEKRTNLAHSTCSRSLALLAGLSKLRTVATKLDMINFVDDEVDRRVRYAVLSENGRAKLDVVYRDVAQHLSRMKTLKEE